VVFSCLCGCPALRRFREGWGLTPLSSVLLLIHTSPRQWPLLCAAVPAACLVAHEESPHRRRMTIRTQRWRRATSLFRDTTRVMTQQVPRVARPSEGGNLLRCLSPKVAAHGAPRPERSGCPVHSLPLCLFASLPLCLFASLPLCLFDSLPCCFRLI